MKKYIHVQQSFYKGLTVGLCLCISLVASSAVAKKPYKQSNIHPAINNLHNDGPYVLFKENNSLSVNYIQHKQNRLSVASYNLKNNKPNKLKVYYPLDNSSFTVTLQKGVNSFTPPTSVYADTGKILAISDIESNYRVFRDFLLNTKVIDKSLNWSFGSNHLVIVGDVLDRGHFSTQTLWFIYKLEQQAQRSGGYVHFILGNHEVMNMQGDTRYAQKKYDYVAYMLGRKHHQLYAQDTFLGRWLASKNTVEKINGYLFTHGGISPKFAKTKLSLDSINKSIRQQYYTPYNPKKASKELKRLVSYTSSPYWYRGYFKKPISQKKVDKGLARFNAQGVVVGHTIQKKIQRYYKGKVLAVDVKHPQDELLYNQRTSEALLIDNGKHFRVYDNGTRMQRLKK